MAREQDGGDLGVRDLFAAGGHDLAGAFAPYRVGSAFLRSSERREA